MNSRVYKRIISELQTLTGIVSEDINYMVYLLLKDGIMGDEKKRKESKYVESPKPDVTKYFEDLDEWFRNL